MATTNNAKLLPPYQEHQHPQQPVEVSGPSPSTSPTPAGNTVQTQYARIVYISDESRPLLRAEEHRSAFPVAALFFALGWIVPFLWVFGLFFMCSANPNEAWWGKINFLMVALFIILVLFVLSSDPNQFA
ncbi:hypothetical protein BC938DRAFT_478190 [Jimgerdemannia flammicorona]|uniref:Transmembrane protein n=1 Tax=Jimgerdemannia flammicorona TaxID=994334 RepID=A0A433P654_9FUNG|nr:hypothetical protein BC938DRAFT_478190 [Jimgerdemannia flammicorona]